MARVAQAKLLYRSDPDAYLEKARGGPGRGEGRGSIKKSPYRSLTPPQRHGYNEASVFPYT